ncbi:hypothetical protein AAF712_007775 [Marasmius tenuissimus]|uniref:NADP-dependent oxidoreductase domain-containing protein n=1 Tax=Marasmius tenuissimus TaxID=585030 RepID=A0ABR2ZW31_9AGAR
MDQFLIILSPTLPATEQTGNRTTPDDIYAEWYPEPLRLALGIKTTRDATFDRSISQPKYYSSSLRHGSRRPSSPIFLPRSAALLHLSGWSQDTFSWNGDYLEVASVCTITARKLSSTDTDILIRPSRYPNQAARYDNEGQAMRVLGDASDAWEAYDADESPTFSETWRDMEDLMNTGKIRAIGVSNFSIKNLEILLPQCRILPATNQVESHPYLPNHELKAYCDAKGISMTCYSPLGQQHPSEPNSLLGNPIVASIAAKHNIDVAQVLISWGVQRGTIVIPKTENDIRMVTNITLKHLPEEDMISLNELHKRPGCHRSLWKGHSPSGKALGWTYEQLGWNMAVGGIVPSS